MYAEPGERSWSDLYRDPKWREYVREILAERDGKCEICGSGAVTAHHLVYTADVPWEEPHENVLAVCRSCNCDEESAVSRMQIALQYSTRILGRLLNQHALVVLAGEDRQVYVVAYGTGQHVGTLSEHKPPEPPSERMARLLDRLAVTLQTEKGDAT